MACIGCSPVCNTEMEPKLICLLPTHQIKCSDSPFPPLSQLEKEQAWGRELLIADVFARDCDFYRAITAYRRAHVLLSASSFKEFDKSQKNRLLQIDYAILLCYYLGGKYQEAVNVFEASELSQSHPDFFAFSHLLMIVYDCYLQTNQEEKAETVLCIIRKFSPETAEDLSLYQSFHDGEDEEVRLLIEQHRSFDSMQRDFAFYEQFKKSPQKARLLNALLPGAGYYYVGQRRSAITSFLINTLFTAAAYQFFRNGYSAAGVITASLEAGWYFGGINGAGIEAKEFNTRLFEGVGRKILFDNRCFPVLMFETSF